jgi:flagellar FliL protein
LADKASDSGKKKSGGISIMAMLILTILSAAGGAGFGIMTPGIVKTAPVKPQAAVSEHDKRDVRATAVLKPLAPITTNLAHPSSTWIRLETSLVVDQDLGPEADILATKISEDIVGFLRTVPVDQIQGPSGFQHLREDLNDRVRVRSEGRVSELIIQSFIIE